jgi:MFS transporter, DHA3 family, macrolide efflux protein
VVPLAKPASVALASGTSVVTATGVQGVAMSALCLWFATRPGIAGLRRPTP